MVTIASKVCHQDMGVTQQQMCAQAEAVMHQQIQIAFIKHLSFCRQRVLGETSLEVATTWLNLGGVLRAAGKLEEAESACRQCLDIRERQLGSQHTDTAAAQIGKPSWAIWLLVRPYEHK